MDINISEAKAQLSKLINLAYHGEKVVICKKQFATGGSCAAPGRR